MAEQAPCLGHDLFQATYSLMSLNAACVYVICACGRSRALRHEDWEKIEAARARLARTHMAIERTED